MPAGSWEGTRDTEEEGVPTNCSWDLGPSKNLVCTSVSPSVKWVHECLLQPREWDNPIHRGEGASGVGRRAAGE